MASSLPSHGPPLNAAPEPVETPAAPTGTSSPTLLPLLDLFVTAQASPSSHDLSAAAILATLSESRPPTSQGEHEDYDLEEDDDDMDGGILLDGSHEDPSSMETASLPTTAPAIFQGAWQITAGDMSDVPQHTTGQYAAALESYSSEPSTAPQIHVTGGAIPLSLPASAPMYASLEDLGDLYALVNSNEEYLNLLNRDQFLPVSFYYKRFIDSDGPGLDCLSTPDVITREDLHGDECDMQGISWDSLSNTRETVRKKRAAYEESALTPMTMRIRKGITATPDTENYFAFRRMNTKHQAHVVHFQLRNLIAATSRNDIFYANRDVVLRTDASGAAPTTIMDLTKEMTEAGKFSITTLAAAHDVLIAGGFEGEYALTGLYDTVDTPTTVGRIPNRARDGKTHITNHIHLFPSRHNYTPQAVLSSNDNRLRILDCHTNTFTHSFDFPKAVNCSATSPDGRLRVVVGDFREPLITNAETGQIIERFDRAHADDAFACDWSDDGIHVATAAQDSTINIYDARFWKGPLTTLRSELAIPRTLRFSPVGGGPRVLVSAEADDYLNIINAQTFESKQVFDYFGQLAGISMTPDGSSLFMATSESDFGGIMEFDRCGWGESRVADVWREINWVDEQAKERRISWAETVPPGWEEEEDMEWESDRRLVCGRHERQRRGLDLAGLVV